MPAAIELFSILRANKAVRDLFGDVLGSAPRLAAIVVQRPHLLDAAIDPQLSQPEAISRVMKGAPKRLLEAATFEALSRSGTKLRAGRVAS